MGSWTFRSQSHASLQLAFSGEAGASRLREHIEPLLTQIIERARNEKAVRADFTATDVALISRAVSELAGRIPEVGAGVARRHLEPFLKGVAPTPYPRPTPPPLSDAAFESWMRGDSRD